MFEFPKRGMVYYVSPDGSVVNKREDAVLAFDSNWLNPIPVFTPILDETQTEKVVMSCNTVKCGKTCVVFCVAACESKLHDYSDIARRAVILAIENELGERFSWFGEYVRGDIYYHLVGRGRTITFIETGVPIYNFDWRSVGRQLGGGHFSVYIDNFSAPFEVAVREYLQSKEFLRAIGLSCGFERGSVAVFDNEDDRLVNVTQL